MGKEETMQRKTGLRCKGTEEGEEHWRTFVPPMIITCGTRRGEKIKVFYRDIYWIWAQSGDILGRREYKTRKLRDKKIQVGRRH